MYIYIHIYIYIYIYIYTHPPITLHEYEYTFCLSLSPYIYIYSIYIYIYIYIIRCIKYMYYKRSTCGHSHPPTPALEGVWGVNVSVAAVAAAGSTSVAHPGIWIVTWN